MRSSGILMPVSSLASDYGIGTMGKCAYEFADFLSEAGQSYWQILPVFPTGWGDSPYQSFSTFAGNPYFIDLDLLCDEGWLTKQEICNWQWGNDPCKIDYALVYKSKFAALRSAFDRFRKKIPRQFDGFCRREEAWLDDYALYMVEKDRYGGAEWTKWAPVVRARKAAALQREAEDLKEEILFYKMQQYFFYEQWERLKSYVHSKGVKIIGDLPIYVAMDSADVWASPENFYLDEEFRPIEISGCPPDGFSEDGQLWGNPLYNWDAMQNDGYSWWLRRMEHCMKLYDVIRIDHFRGFDSYYSIPYGAKTAKKGTWRKGPGIHFFDFIKKELGSVSVIAEDLGFLTLSVKELLKKTGYPGMKVLQFAFDSREDSDYLPHNYCKNCVVYTGTHDNSTVLGWIHSAPKKDVQYAKEYLKLSEAEGYHWGMMRGAWASVGDIAIVTAQDILGLDDSARMNTPSTVGENWRWRAGKNVFSKELAEKIKNYTRIYKRLPQEA